MLEVLRSLGLWNGIFWSS